MNWKKHKLPALLMLMIVVYSCASMGTPDGGPYDEEPPKFVRSSPKPYATNNKDKKIAIEFDGENIRKSGGVSSSIGTT